VSGNNTITLTTGAALNDELNVVAFKSFTVADAVPKSTGGQFDANVDFAAGIDVTGNITVTGTVDGRDVATDGTKLDGVEAGATADQTAAEIKTAYESNADTNEFSDAEQTKLAGIEANATADQTAAEIKTSYESNTNTNAFTDAEQTKLADQTAAEIKTAYESNANTNAFTDAEQTKLTGIEANATADQTAAEIRVLVESAIDSNVFTDADHTKLNAIEANAKDDQTITAGSGLTGGGTGDVTLNHADTSAQASLIALTGANVVSDIDLDTYGHVTNLATRTMTLANLGYTGATNANNYVHPTHPGDDFSVDTGALTGATVVSDIDINVTTDSLGHVTDANGFVATRTLTLADLGYTGATNANYITNNNQLTNGAGYTTNVGDITGVTAGTNLSGGGTSGTVTLNVSSNPSFTDVYVADQIFHTGDTDTYMQFHAGDQWRVVTGGAERLEVNNSQITSTEPIHAPSFHGDGSSLTGVGGETGFVNFNGTGTPSIRADSRISTITDNGTGNYTLAFSSNFSDANYAATSATSWVGAGVDTMIETSDTSDGTPTSKTSSQIRVNCTSDSNNHIDLDNQNWIFNR
jgi:hypothetical protein